MAFRLTDGTVHYIDMDLNVPSVSVSNGHEYEVGDRDYLLFLMRTRPVLWREEMFKLEDMTGRGGVRGAERSVRVRSINPNTVTTSEVRMVEFNISSFFFPFLITDNNH